MQSITATYLTDIIFRAINETILLRRASQKNHLHCLNYPKASEEEIADFILSIPYLDEQLKNILMDKQKETTTIISQTWETAFIVTCKSWAHSNDWLHKDPICLIGFYPQYIINCKDALKLPY